MDTEVRDGIQTTVMAVRETLMEYFKGTCVEKFTQDSNVTTTSVSPQQQGQFQYLRERESRQNPMMLWVGKVPILSLQKFPERVEFYARPLTRSPQLSQLYDELQVFMGKYLVSVEVSHNKKGIFYA